jgi:hypothetical protein
MNLVTMEQMRTHRIQEPVNQLLQAKCDLVYLLLWLAISE